MEKLKFIESIRINDGLPCNMAYHQKRFDYTRGVHFLNPPEVNLQSVITVPDEYKLGEVKCRIVYHKSVIEVSFVHYQRKNIQRLKIVYDDEIDYNFKYFNRANLDRLYEQKDDAQEILICKNGLLTDAYYFNIVMENSAGLFTPKSPLLNGTMRQYLMDTMGVKEADILPDQISSYHRIHLVNAMNPLGRVVVSPMDVLV